MSPVSLASSAIAIALAIAVCPLAAEPDLARVPGTVITHRAASSGTYLGSPGIAVLADGSYLAKCDEFGPNSTEHERARSFVFRSEDRGRSWRRVAVIDGLFWANIFEHHGGTFLIGTNKHHGDLVILRSDDRGETWTQPTDAEHGLLARGQYHTAPMPMLIHAGRLWRAVEDASNGEEWGARYSPFVMSTPLDADLLNAASWRRTNHINRNPEWMGGRFAAWLEGNAVATPDGRVVDILRMHYGGAGGKAAVVRVSEDGTNAQFDPDRDIIDFPGGAKKFTIRFDPRSKAYWALVNPLMPGHHSEPAGSIRNTLALIRSNDLVNWKIVCILLHHPDSGHHGFQYPDWLFDGDDLIAAIRTAYDDGLGGAHNAHDANLLTFHRFQDFRELTLEDSVVDPAELVDSTTQSRALSYRHFTVEERDDQVIATTPVADADPARWARQVSQEAHDWPLRAEPHKPSFEGPIPFVIPPTDAGEPFHRHNHQPSITWLANGDLLAIWYSTGAETGTELTVLASRLRSGAERWDPSAEFYKAPDRNMHGSAIFHDGKGTVYHFNGMGPKGGEGWARLALLLRTSRDNGVTWTPPRAIDPNVTGRHQVISGTILTSQGVLIQNCDAVPGGNGGTALHISHDGGKTWIDPGVGKPRPRFEQNVKGEGTIAGIHAKVVELKDGRLMALGRGDSIDGRMPMSVSADLGKTWTYHASSFPPIGGGQRLVLKRLREGPILFASFTSGDRRRPEANGMTFTDQDGGEFIGHGLFAALSFDEGETWPVRKLITPGRGEFDGGAHTGPFTATPTRGEHAGYLAATQSPDHVIHLISSRLHYRFNLTWLLAGSGKGASSLR